MVGDSLRVQPVLLLLLAIRKKVGEMFGPNGRDTGPRCSVSQLMSFPTDSRMHVQEVDVALAEPTCKLLTVGRKLDAKA